MYAWGRGDITQRINIDKEAYNVSEHVLDTINLIFDLQLTKDRIEQRLWINAIYIDQADLEKKAEQISYMTDIYS